VVVGLCLGLGAGLARGAEAHPSLVLGGSVEPGGELERFLQEDRTWLAQQPPGLLAAPPADSLAALRGWVERALASTPAGEGQATAAGDSVSGARPLLAMLRDRWLSRGYLAVRFEQAVPPGDTEPPIVSVFPGKLFRVGSLEVGGEDFPGRARLLETVLPRPGARLQREAWQRTVARLLAGVGELGYPFARWLVRSVTVDPDAGTVTLEAALFPGLRCYLGPQTSDLPAGRGHRFLTRASALRTGALFRHSELARARDRLVLRGIYRRVGEPAVYRGTAPDTVGIHWPVEPITRPNRLAVVLGFNQQEEGPGRLSGQVDLVLPNLAGTGRALRAGWSDDGRERTHFGFGYREPLAFGTPLDAELALDHEVYTDLYTRFRADTRWRLPVIRAWGIEVGLGWDRTTFPDTSYSFTRTSRIRGRVAFIHQRGDPAVSGWEGVFAIETAHRQAILRPGAAGNEETGAAGIVQRQRLLEADLGGEIWLGSVWSLAGRSAYREVRGEGIEITLAEQYRFGGALSVRGYREDEFRGERVAYGSIELRVGRTGGSRLYTFFDMGYFQFSLPVPGEPGHRQERDGTVRGFGLGLQTHTPGGDISLAIGFPGSVNFDDAMLHVALLEVF